MWQFDARKVGQTEQDGRRYATGIRSLVAMTWNQQVHELYALQHGRDDLYPVVVRSTSPGGRARCCRRGVLPGHRGLRRRLAVLLLRPDAGQEAAQSGVRRRWRETGDGAKLTPPLLGFPGHSAPNDLLFYDGNQFPERYRRGAFIAFHGSTIRMPYSQAGYIVAFVPIRDGAPSGDWEVFADGFAGVDPIPNTGDAAARPMGLALGSDGSLYISDSVKGRIWKVDYRGRREAFGAAQLAPMEARKTQQAHIRQPDEQKDILGREMLAAGGAGLQTYCVACHQGDGKGDGARFPSLAWTSWVSGNKQRLISVVLYGLQGEIEVEGQTFNDSAAAFLTDERYRLYSVSAAERRCALKPGDVAEVRANPPTPWPPLVRWQNDLSSRADLRLMAAPERTWPHGPVIANVMPGVWMLVNSQRPSRL